MQTIAERDRFRQIAFGIPSIGGRYSVLSDFGLVPAAAMGLDIGRLLGATRNDGALLRRRCAAGAIIPGVVLGTVLGVLGKAGRDKVTIVASPGIADFGAWLEQLLAESTGKQGKGLIPVDAEPLGPPDVYGHGSPVRLCAAVGRSRCEAGRRRRRARTRRSSGGAHRRHRSLSHRPGILPLGDRHGGRGRDPRHQSVRSAGRRGQQGQDARTDRRLREDRCAAAGNGASFKRRALRSSPTRRTARHSGRPGRWSEYLAAHFARIREGDYCALLAYVERNKHHQDALQDIRVLIRDRKRVATCLGFGPRFLHSTGQAYKGGPNTGVFLQITCDDAADLQVPDQKYTFGVVKAAEARGDFEVLAERERRVLRVHLGPHVAAGLTTLTDAVRQALA